MLFWTRIRNRVETTTASTPTTSITTLGSTSTTLKYRQQSKKGSVCVNIYGKHFSREQKTFLKSCCENGSHKSGNSKDSENCKNLLYQQQQKMNSKYFGYMTDSEDFVNLPIPADETFTSTNILKWSVRSEIIKLCFDKLSF